MIFSGDFKPRLFSSSPPRKWSNWRYAIFVFRAHLQLFHTVTSPGPEARCTRRMLLAVKTHCWQISPPGEAVILYHWLGVQHTVLYWQVFTCLTAPTHRPIWHAFAVQSIKGGWDSLQLAGVMWRLAGNDRQLCKHWSLCPAYPTLATFPPNYTRESIHFVANYAACETALLACIFWSQILR